MDNILKFLPEFKVVEPNRLTGLVTGHVLSQFPLATDSTLINDVNGKVNVIENGAIVGLNADLLVDAYDAKTMGHPFLVFTEELNTIFDGLKFFATAEDADGEIYPRGVALYVGDVFTTNNYAGATEAATHAKVVDGVLTLQTAADADTLFAVEESTLPLGDEAFKFIYIGNVVEVNA